jgi:hypothetical protein
LQRLCFEPDVAADASDRGENRDPGTATEAFKIQLTEETRLENDLRLGRAENNTRLVFALGLRSPAHGILQRDRNLGTADLDRSEVIPQSAVFAWIMSRNSSSVAVRLDIVMGRTGAANPASTTVIVTTSAIFSSPSSPHRGGARRQDRQIVGGEPLAPHRHRDLGNPKPRSDHRVGPASGRQQRDLRAHCVGTRDPPATRPPLKLAPLGLVERHPSRRSRRGLASLTAPTRQECDVAFTARDF